MNFIKRVVAAPGDRISIEDGHAVLNGKRQTEDFVRPCQPEDACEFPDGDHRSSRPLLHDGRQPWLLDDSRFLGPVPEKWIIGQAFATYWPPGRIGLL